MVRSWWRAAAVLAFGIVFAFAVNTPAMALVFLAPAYLFSPLVFPRSLMAAEAQRRSAADGHSIVYWRPSCPFCLRLRRKLGRDAGKVYWVNIWRDPEGAAAVRAIADGNETVPTVVAGQEAVVNPDPAWLLARVR